MRLLSMSPPSGDERLIPVEWNTGLIAASIGISLLGAFTSTQLICQARASRHFSGALVWMMLGSLTFGFCSIWSLHEVAMLACEMDLPIGIDVPLTILSSVLAVGFTFAALSADMLWGRYTHVRRRRARDEATETWQARLDQEFSSERAGTPMDPGRGSMERLLSSADEHTGRQSMALDEETLAEPTEPSLATPFSDASFHQSQRTHSSSSVKINGKHTETRPISSLGRRISPSFTDEDTVRRASPHSWRGGSSTDSTSGTSVAGLGNFMSVRVPKSKEPETRTNVFVTLVQTLYVGTAFSNITKGFLWSLAITGMHYVGIMGLRIPQGYVVLSPGWVLLSGAVSWIVCVVGLICMANMETHFGQQLLFSLIATSGVAGMHFSGMRAATFWTEMAPSDKRGYPAGLGSVIAGIAVVTCIAANALLAHTTTVSRNKLAEIVYTRRKLWMAIAQKENAETAARARSEFIASASHEIRTPLHHLQGYSDLLARMELSDDARLLLLAIQRATKTLSLITNNVLDWSRLERDGEAVSTPVALDMRDVCESIVTLLPNDDEDTNVELMVVVAPNVPTSLFLDETYIHRVLMNLLSNALKFTTSGYILLSVEMHEGQLVCTVKDSGVGIPESFLPQLFEPFKQAQTRGSSRGTGLGLSITRQLLKNMGGNIEVISRHPEAGDIDPEESGSTFIVTLPLPPLTAPQPLPLPSATSKVAIFHGGNSSALAGLCLAWSKFNYEPVVASSLSELANNDFEYVWADLDFLSAHPEIFSGLVDQTQWPVLVPCDTPGALLHAFPRPRRPPQHFVPLPKPVLWHAISRAVASGLPREEAKAVRFAATPRSETVADPLAAAGARLAPTTSPSPPSPHEDGPRLILLVEDNPINRKLGTKMLSSLGYGVVTAEHGEEAVRMVSRRDMDISAVLMDQSMPQMDGVTATREIRRLEREGALGKRHTIIAVTAVVSAESAALCREAGMDDFLPKPLSLGKLGQVLAQWVGGDSPGA